MVTGRIQDWYRKIFCIKEISSFPWGNCLPHYVDQNFLLWKMSDQLILHGWIQDSPGPRGSSGGSRIFQKGALTLEFGAKTYYLARFLLKTALKWKNCFPKIEKKKPLWNQNKISVRFTGGSPLNMPTNKIMDKKIPNATLCWNLELCVNLETCFESKCWYFSMQHWQ